MGGPGATCSPNSVLEPACLAVSPPRPPLSLCSRFGFKDDGFRSLSPGHWTTVLPAGTVYSMAYLLLGWSGWPSMVANHVDTSEGGGDECEQSIAAAEVGFFFEGDANFMNRPPPSRARKSSLCSKRLVLD